ADNVSVMTLGGAIGVVKETRALLDADIAHDADTLALVYGDSTDANNDIYVKVGAPGAGSWTLTSALHDSIGGIAQPYVDQMEALLTDGINIWPDFSLRNLADLQDLPFTSPYFGTYTAVDNSSPFMGGGSLASASGLTRLYMVLGNLGVREGDVLNLRAY